MKEQVKVSVLLFIFLSVNIQMLNALDEKAYHEKGKIIDTVPCKINPKYSYALYLPGTYSDNVKWPIIYIFDPGARGRLGLSGFIPAAERLGYIAVCSNNSKNFISGPELEEAINSMFIDTEARFSIDPRRIYTGGFSGGSRVAAMLALNNNNISGVIGCGAGFPYYSDFSHRSSFNYFELVGNRDMNYLEMCDLEKKLDNLGMSVELRIFNGGHTWPSPDLLEEAVEWLELKAMYKGTKNKDPDFINELFTRYNRKAESLLNQGDISESVRYYKYIAQDFPDNHSITKIKSKIDSLFTTKSYTKAIKNWNKNRTWEMEIQSNLVEDLNLRVRNKIVPDSIRTWWTRQVKMLRSMETSRDTTNQAIASRVLMLINAMCYETGRKFMSIKNFKAASICFQVEALIEPENKNIHFLLARIYSLNGETDESLKSLVKAIKMGYDNRQSIEKDSAFIPLKSEKRFKEVMMQLK